MGRNYNKKIREFEIKRYWFEHAGDKDEEGYYNYYYAGFIYDLKFDQLTYSVRRYADTPAEAAIFMPEEKKQDEYNLHEDQLLETVVKYCNRSRGSEKLY